jgi:hypothetical protein
MGSVCSTEPGKTHRLRIEAYPDEGTGFSCIELIGTHGAALAGKRDFTGGVLEYEIPGSAEPGYVVWTGNPIYLNLRWIFSVCAALAIMKRQDVETPGSIPIRIDRCRRMDEPTPTVSHRLLA